jgi:hypothetical protein
MRKVYLVIALTLLMAGAAHAQFAIETVAVGEYDGTEMALDADGDPLICFYDNAASALGVAEWNGAAWEVVTADNVGDVGQDCSIVVGANGNVHVAYLSADEYDIRYARRIGANWNALTLYESGYIGLATDITLAPDGEPRISYIDGTVQEAGYIWFEGAGYIGSRPDDWRTIGGQATGIVASTTTESYIAGYDQESGFVTIFKGHDLTWDVYDVDGMETEAKVGWDLAFAGDDSGALHLAYYDQTNGEASYAWGPWGDMQTEIFDGSDWCGHPLDLAVEGNGRPHVCYFSSTAQELRYGYRVGAEGWEIFVIDQGEGVGLDCSLAVAPDNTVTIAYYDETANALKVARGAYAPPLGDDDDDDDDDNDADATPDDDDDDLTPTDDDDDTAGDDDDATIGDDDDDDDDSGSCGC